MFRKFFILVASVTLTVALGSVNTNAQGANRCGSGNFNQGQLLIVGLTTDQRLVCFSENLRGRVVNIGTVSGLVGDTALIGIDYRVQDGELYGVGNMGGVYMLSTATAAATLVNNLTVALSGTAFGVDFNPAADRLRIISNTGQNLRHNVNPGGVTINDGTLTYTPPPAAPVPAQGVTGAAYTNNDLDPSTATTLFVIDSNLDQVAIQSPANNGILVATGRLGVDAIGVTGFDIYSSRKSSATVDNKAFAVISTDAGYRQLYYVSLLTGKATWIGNFGADNEVFKIAIPLDQTGGR